MGRHICLSIIYFGDMMKVTQQMKDRFNTRGNEHITSVKRNAINLIHGILKDNLDIIDISEFAIQVSDHDSDKFEYPNYDVQVFRGWQAYSKRRGLELAECSVEDEALICKTVFDHVKSNNHHPEYWDDNITLEQYSTNYYEQFDNPDFYVVDGTLMSKEGIAEMVCDWTAVAQEFGKNSARDWADEMIDKRWRFTPEQVNFIYQIINILETY